MQTLLSFVMAMSITMVLIPLLMRWAVPLGIIDLPASRKVHQMPIPRVGGIAMVAGILLAMIPLGMPDRPMQALIAGMMIQLVFGVWDDRRPLRAGPKFLGQALAVLVAMFWGGVRIAVLTPGDRVGLPQWVAIPVTFFFLMGGTNAFNLADGLDGLAGGIATLCLCGTALLAYTVDYPVVGGFAIAIIGALMGFLRYNTHPARVFMGDGGSQVLGFAASVLVVMLTQAPENALSTALPLLLLGMPLIDTLMVMVERVWEGRSPFLADQRHIHHRLLAMGFAHWEAVSILYLLQGFLFVVAWLMRYDTDLEVAAFFALFSSAVLFVLYVVRLSGWRVRKVGSSGQEQTDARNVIAGPRTQTLTSLLVGATLLVFAVWVFRAGDVPSRELSWVALGLAAVLLATIFWLKNEGFGWLDKAALYCGATLAVYLCRQTVLDVGHPPLLLLILFPAMALAVVACIRSSPQQFRVTPLDILVLLLVLTVPNLPNSVASERSQGFALAELVLIFYAFEALSLSAARSWRWVSALASLFLCAVAARSFM